MGCPVSSSDHNSLHFQLIVGSMRLKDNSLKFSYHKGNYAEISERLRNKTWSWKSKDLSVE